MERLLLIIFIYIIFGVIGPLIRRSQRKQQQALKESSASTPGEQTPKQQVGAKAGAYYKRLQDAFQSPPPSELPTPQKDESKLLSIPAKSAQPEEKALELFPPPLPAKPRVVSTRPTSYRQAPPRRTQVEEESLLGFNKRGGYMRGIILAEILGPPVSKRSRTQK